MSENRFDNVNQPAGNRAEGASDVPSVVPPPAQVPGYELQTFLGRGAYGEVWSARDQKTGRSVAIKFYSGHSSSDVQRLAQEVEKLVVLAADRYVVQLLDVGWEAKPPYLVMDYIERGSLEEKLAHGSTMSVVEATELFTEIATGMMHLHGKGILHCDLKPGNVLLDRGGKPRLADFGQARLESDETASLGTLFFMAPEQADTQAVPDQRWDVYSLGALFYCLLTGKPPYYEVQLAESIQRIEGIQGRLQAYRAALPAAPRPQEHRQIAGVDRSLAEIIDRCIAVDPKARFRSVQEVLLALRQRAAAKARQPLLVLGLLGPLVLLAVMALFSWYAYQQAKSETETAVLNKAVESNLFAAKLGARSVSEKVDEYYRAVRSLAISPEFVRDFEALVQDEAFARLREQLADPNDNEDRSLDPLREEFLNGFPQREQVDRYLRERMENRFGQWPRAASWVAYDRQGNQVAARFSDPDTINTIGKNYSYRSYFTGLERDLVERDPAGGERFQVEEEPGKRAIIEHPNLSAIFRSQATMNWKITFSAPIRVGQEVVGVVGCSVEMGDFVDFDDGQGQYAMLVDNRPGDNTGVILEHPWFDQLRERGEKLPDNLTGRRVEDVSSYGSSAVLFKDPIGGELRGSEFDKLWIAAAEPVTRLNDFAGSADSGSLSSVGFDSGDRVPTGMYVLAAEDYHSVIQPVNDLTRQLSWLGLAAVGFFVVVAVGMWLFVMRLLAGARGGVERVDVPVPGQSSLHKQEVLDSEGEVDEFRTVAPADSKSYDS
ncbi:MAG: serine/threonine-protein kinase [Planctomycetota bacterium]|nr:serine/threonine-protein kinase [Planctomycetota bacterium]